MDISGKNGNKNFFKKLLTNNKKYVIINTEIKKRGYKNESRNRNS